MSGTPIPKSDTLRRRAADSGYVVAWRCKYEHRAGRFPDEMTYGEACAQAARMQAAEPDKAFWAEMSYHPQTTSG